MKEIMKNGMLTISKLTEEEAEQYRKMEVGIIQTKDKLISVAEKDGIKQIIEQTADGFSRIRVKATMTL